MPVRDYCCPSPVTASPGESIRDVARRMDARQVGCVVVVDAEDKPVGILTDRDVVMRVLRRSRDPEATTVGDVMQSEVSVVRAGAPLARALRRMRSDGVRRLPVVDEEGRLAGIVGLDDALQLLSCEMAGIAEVVRAQFPPERGAPAAAASVQGG